MKLTKKLAVLLLAAAMALAFAACQPAQPESADQQYPAESSAPQTQDSTPAPAGKGFKICIVTSSGVDDGSFNQNCYEGIQAFLTDHPDCAVTDIKEPDMNEIIPTVERMAGDYDVFVLPGFEFSGIGYIAQANPDKKFLVVDSTINDSEGNAITLDNVYTMTFSEQESGFFAGVAAAMETRSNKVAVVNGMAFPSNVNYQFGFMSGVNYANAHYGSKAEYVELPSYAGVDVNGAPVGGNYIGNFVEPADGKVVGDALVAEGCDVLFVAAGNAGNGVFTSAKEADGVWLIGCDVDQYDDGFKGDKNIMLTSGMKIMDVNVRRQLEAIYDGTFKGQDAFLGAGTDSTGYAHAEGRHNLSAPTLEKLAECYELVKNGTIVPASNFNGHTPTDFPGL